MRGRSFVFQRRKALSVLLPAAVAVSLVGCPQAPRRAVSVPDVVWPKPPDTPRVRFLFLFSSPEDLGVKEPWHRRVGRLVTGTHKQEIRLAAPHDVCADVTGRSYVTDTATRSVHVFDGGRGTHAEISAAGTGEGRLLSPIGVAVHSDGRLFVCDSLLAAVFMYEASGRFLKSIGKGELVRPTGIALDEIQGRLYVVDTLAHAVKIFGLDGVPGLTIGGRGKEEGQFNYPTCIAVDGDGRIYVGDSLNFRVQVFDRAGACLSHFGEAGDGTGYFSQIKGLDVDSEGHIYVTDARFDVIQVFTREGEYLLSIGGPGRGPGEFNMPAGLHIDERDRIYVVDRLNQRVQVFQYISVKNE